MNEFKSVSGTVQWKTDGESITIVYGKQRMKAVWSEITRAGLVGYPRQKMPENFPYEILPGLRRLTEIRDNLAKSYLQLVLARGGSPFKAFRVPIPKEDPDAKLLLDEVQRNLGDRWLGELPWNRYTQALGLRNPWWFYPAFVIGFVFFGLILLMAMGAYGGIMSGRLDQVPLIAWIALLLWSGVVVWILAKLRARSQK